MSVIGIVSSTILLVLASRKGLQPGGETVHHKGQKVHEGKTGSTDLCDTSCPLWFQNSAGAASPAL